MNQNIKFILLIPVEVLALFLTLSEMGHASTGSNFPASSQILASSGWSSKDSWSGGDELRSSTRSPRSREISSETSPFSPGSHNISLDIGQVFLLGGLTKYDNSIGTQLHYNFGVSDLFTFDSSIGFSQHSNNQYDMVNVLGGLRLNFSWYDKIIPYGVIGLGFYKPSFMDTTAPTAPPTLTNPSGTSQPYLTALLFGMYIGPGFDLVLSKNMFFGASLTYHQMFGVTKGLSNGALLDLGGQYFSFYAHIGASF